MKTGLQISLQDQSRAKTIRTLLVDDSPFMLKILTQILAREDGFTVVGAAVNGRQAIEYAVTQSPDLILMDFDMPLLNGATATQYIKHLAAPPIIFIVTSDDSSSSRIICKAAGADAYIVKSADFSAQLGSKLQAWFGSTSDGTRHGENQSERP